MLSCMVLNGYSKEDKIFLALVIVCMSYHKVDYTSLKPTLHFFHYLSSLSILTTRLS